MDTHVPEHTRSSVSSFGAGSQVCTYLHSLVRKQEHTSLAQSTDLPSLNPRLNISKSSTLPFISLSLVPAHPVNRCTTISFSVNTMYGAHLEVSTQT